MRKAFRWLLLVAVVLGSFWGGALYSQRGPGKQGDLQAGRRILYYQDPMNPAHTSDKPGMAPCGMPMEPVYADQASGVARRLPPGTATITPERQQAIGVRLEPAQVSSHEHVLRTLGRVKADENRTHSLTAS